MGQLGQCDFSVGRDEERHFRQAVDNDEDASIAVGHGQLLDEIHGNRIPRSLGDQELPKESVRPMANIFASFTGHA